MCWSHLTVDAKTKRTTPASLGATYNAGRRAGNGLTERRTEDPYPTCAGPGLQAASPARRQLRPSPTPLRSQAG